MSLLALSPSLINLTRSFLPLTDHVAMNGVNTGFRGSAQRVSYEKEITPDQENYTKVCSLVFKHVPTTPLDFDSMTTATISLKLREIRVIGDAKGNSYYHHYNEDNLHGNRIGTLLSAHEKTLESVAFIGKDNVTEKVTKYFLRGSWPALRHVRFEVSPLPQLARFFQRHANLEKVHLGGIFYINETQLDALTDFCSRLRYLRVWGTSGEMNIAPLAQCEFLENLEIHNSTFEGLDQIAEGCPRLKTIDVSYSIDPPEGLVEIANRCTMLQKVKYGRIPGHFYANIQEPRLKEQDVPAFIALVSNRPNCMIHTYEHPNGVLGKDAYAPLPSLCERICAFLIDTLRCVYDTLSALFLRLVS